MMIPYAMINMKNPPFNTLVWGSLRLAPMNTYMTSHKLVRILDECRALWGEPEQAVCQVKSGLLLTSIGSEHTARLLMFTGSCTIRKAVEKSQLFNYQLPWSKGIILKTAKFPMYNTFRSPVPRVTHGGHISHLSLPCPMCNTWGTIKSDLNSQ